MSAAKVLKMMKDNEVKFVDLRFTDSRGKEQHVTLPSSEINNAFFKDGKMFDGSSIAGWKGIHESDMVLMPDAETAVMDPFTDEPNMILRCDILEPSTMKGYERDPRSVARRAEEYLKSTGIADSALFGPENEFFILDDVRWGVTMEGAFYKVDSDEAHWNSDRSPSQHQGWLLPGAPGGLPERHPRRHVPGHGGDGPRGRGAPPRGGHRRPVRDRCGRQYPGEEGRRGADPEVRGLERGPRLRQDRHLHAQAAGG
jgi:glutamine synthetase